MPLKSFAVALLLIAGAAAAQELPAPQIKLGGTIFADYTYVDGASLSSFNVSRAYINVTGTVGPLISFRITPDVARESGSGSSLSGSQTFRLKYAYGQLNLDSWTTKGSFVRFGLQQTPYIDYAESIYRYRFQGPIFIDREGFGTSSDNGVSARYVFPYDLGDVHAGFYNGEGYSKAELNNEKSFQIRASVRPLKGLRLTIFQNSDAVRSGVDRNRTLGSVTFEHARGNAGFEALQAKDGSSKSHGWSAWATPKLTHGWETLLRYDNLRASGGATTHKRDIEGIAYWVPLKNASAAVMLDRDHAQATGKADDTRFGLKVLLSF